MDEPRHILLVDDDPQLIRATQLRLRAAGFETDSAFDGDEGVHAARALQPDAILLDVRMPRKDGLTALAELQANPETRHIPVVMLSASVVDQKRALDAGASCFLTKPYDGKNLLATVEAVLEKSQLKMQLQH